MAEDADLRGEQGLPGQALEAQASELNRPARDDIKRVLSVTWEMDGRKSLAPTIVKAYMAYTRDDTALLNIGLQGAPTESRPGLLRALQAALRAKLQEQLMKVQISSICI